MLGFAAGLVLGLALGAAAAHALRRRRLGVVARFLSFAGHELNTPLTAVMMTVSNLAGGVFGSTQEQQKPWLELLREQVARLSALVGELRDFVHMELRGDLAVMLEDLQPAELAEEALRTVRSGLAQASVPLEVSVPEDLPAVRGDADKAGRTLASLLYHARKFRTAGPIRLGAARDGAFVAFVIEFEAPGLDAGEARAALEVLYPGAAQRETLKATGLGLGLSRALLERQGGSLGLSVEGQSHRLTMRLPAQARK